MVYNHNTSPWRAMRHAVSAVLLALVACEDHPLEDPAVTDSPGVDVAQASAPSGGTVLFQSDWTTATGASDAALRDTGQAIPWDRVIGTGEATVVSAAGLDFPTPNVLQVNGIYNPNNRSLRARQVTVLPRNNRWPIPAIGQSLFFRYYRRVVWPSTLPSLYGHPTEEVSGTRGNWQWEDVATNVTGIRLAFASWPSSAAPVKFDLGPSASPIYLARNVTYRIEWQIQRISETQFNVHVRIHNSAGTLLYTDAHFVNRWNQSQTLADNPTFTFRDVNNLDGFQMGTNGPGINTGGNVAPAWYYGGVAVCTDWCGPYVTGGSPAPVASVDVTPAADTVTIGSEAQLTAVVRDASGNILSDRTVSWRSRDTLVARVTATGVVTGVAIGAVYVLATSEGRSDSAHITVAQAPVPVPVASVTVSPASATVAPGTTIQLTATTRDAAGNALTGRTVAWATSSAAVATVSAGGLVTGVAPGTAAITATSEGRSGSASVTVTASAGGSLLFHSDWSTATGSTDAALRDTGKSIPWTQIGGNGRLNQVVPAATLGFPTTNALRVEVNALGQAQIHRLEGLRVLAVGESLYYRWYIRVVAPNGLADVNTHPIQDAVNAGTSDNWGFNVETPIDDEWRMMWQFNGADFPNHIFRLDGFSKTQTYRVEFHQHRVSATHFQVDVRVYNEAGELVANDSNFQNANRTGTLANSPNIPYQDINETANLQGGINGLASPPGATVMYYQGGFCVRQDDWCGPYRDGR